MAGRAKEAAESMLPMVHEESNITDPIKTWVSGELMFSPPSSNCAVDVAILYQTLNIVAAGN